MKVAHPETITIIRATLGPHGDPTDTVEVDIPGCAITPGGVGSEDASFQQDVNTSRLVVIVPPKAYVRATDMVRARGQLYAVDGPPELLRSPLSGHDFGSQISLVLTTG